MVFVIDAIEMSLTFQKQKKNGLIQNVFVEFKICAEDLEIETEHVTFVLNINSNQCVVFSRPIKTNSRKIMPVE